MGLFNEHSSTTKTDSSISQIPGPQGIGYKLDANGNFDIENKKLTNVKNGDMNKDVMTKSQIEGYVSNKTQYLDGVLPAKVTNNKAVIYSPSGGIHSNGLYLKDQYEQEVHFYNEDQDDNQIRLYIPNLKNNDSFGGRLKSSLVITSLDQIIEGRKVFHDIEVPNPTIDGNASNKAYVDNEITKISDNYVRKSGDTMTGKLLVPNVFYPIQGDLRQAISYESMREIFLSRHESRSMRTNLDMSNNSIDNVKNAEKRDQAVNKGMVDDEFILKANKSDLLEYLKTNGSYPMKGNIQMNGNRITGLTKVPFYNGEVVNKKYVDDQSNKFLKVNGDNFMLADIRMNGYKITGLTEKPTKNYDATNKEYVDDNIKKSQIGEAHTSINILSYIMKDIDQTTSEYGIEVDKIDDFDSSFHRYNKKVIYLNLIKDDNSYESRIGYNIFRLVDKNIDKTYTFVTEWLTTDNNSWNKMEIFSNITAGEIIGYHSKKYEDGNGLYYIRTITQLKIMKISTTPLYFYSTIHIENVNPTYPAKFKEVYNIIYGIEGRYENIPSKVYDNHNFFESSGENMKMLVDLDINNKKILNIENITDIKIFGKVNKHIFSTNNIRVYFEKTFIKKIYLYGNDRTNSKNGTLIFLTPGITSPRYRFTFPSEYNEQIVIITINRYFESLRRITLIEFDNLPYIINYNLFY